MENIIAQVIVTYNWPKDYVEKVLFEYFRFLQLKHKYQNVSPSDDIDKFWHQHILNPKSYYAYCMKTFGEIIDHNPSDAFDQNKRKERIKNSLDRYILEYGPIKYDSVWNLKNNKINGNNQNTKQIKVIIGYTFDIFNKSNEFIGKKWKPNNFSYDKKTLLYNITSNDTIDSLKNSIQNKTGHNRFAIKIYANKDLYDKKIGFDNSLHDGKLWEIDTNIFYAILEEMTSNGYC